MKRRKLYAKAENILRRAIFDPRDILRIETKKNGTFWITKIFNPEMF